MDEEKLASAIKGAIGEFYVASYLSALGFVVALPRGGVPSSDLLVTTANGDMTLSLQVKTATKPFNTHGIYGKYLTWGMSQKAKSNNKTTHWYVLVDQHGWPRSGKEPDLYFVPSCDVANCLNTDWNKQDETWLFFPLFDEVNTETEKYTTEGENASSYNGLKGFEKLKEALYA